MGIIPVNFFFVDGTSRLIVRQHYQKHVIRSKTKTVQVIKFLFLADHVSIYEAITVISGNSFRYNPILFFTLISFNSFNWRMQISDTHSSNFYVILRFNISSSNMTSLSVQGIVNFSWQLRVFIEVRNMGFWIINFYCIEYFFLLLMLFFSLLCQLSISDCLVYVPLLLFCLSQFIQHLCSNSSCLKFTEHFLHLLNFEPKSLPFLCKCPN